MLATSTTAVALCHHRLGLCIPPRCSTWMPIGLYCLLTLTTTATELLSSLRSAMILARGLAEVSNGQLGFPYFSRWRLPTSTTSPPLRHPPPSRSSSLLSPGSGTISWIYHATSTGNSSIRRQLPRSILEDEVIQPLAMKHRRAEALMGRQDMSHSELLLCRGELPLNRWSSGRKEK